jgi:hypothetical protein
MDGDRENYGNTMTLTEEVAEIRRLQAKVTTMDKKKADKEDNHEEDKINDSQPLAQALWDARVPENSIESWLDFQGKFIQQFSGSRHIKVTATSIFATRQNHAETLREYLARFSEATIKVSNPNQEMFVSAFHNGLKVGHFNESLA